MSRHDGQMRGRFCWLTIKTGTYSYHRLGALVARHLKQETDPVFSGEIEVDQSDFGGKVEGNRAPAAAGKIPVSGLLNRGGKSDTKLIPDPFQRHYLRSSRRKSWLTGFECSDGCRGDDRLEVSDFNHLRINHSRMLPDKANHINEIENFWNQYPLV